MKLGIVACAAIALTTVGAAASHPKVGTASLQFDGAPGNRRIAAEVWFEATPDANVARFSARAPFQGIDIARGAMPAKAAKRPLIVVSHGNWGNPFSNGWLSKALVERGYVVVSLLHPGTSSDDQTVAGRTRLWDRATDVSFALDKVLADAHFAPLIDETRIGFAGHSFGGWTGIALGGGIYDPDQQRRACAAMAPKDFYCAFSLKDDVSAVSRDGAGRSFADPRIKAVYAMATGPSSGFSDASLKAIRIPVLIDTALHDEVLAAGPNSTRLATLIPGAVEIKRDNAHFAYIPVCRPFIGRAITWVLDLPLCNDRPNTDRAAVHARVIEDATAFFGKALSGKP